MPQELLTLTLTLALSPTTDPNPSPDPNAHPHLKPYQARLKSATALVCAAPAHVSGAVRVRVSLNGGADFGGASLPYAYTCDGHAAIVPCVLDEGCGWCGPPDAKDGGACAARGGGGSGGGGGLGIDGGDSSQLRTPPRRHPAKLATGATQADCGGAWSEARRLELGHMGDLSHNGSAAPGAHATLSGYHPYHMTSPTSAAPQARTPSLWRELSCLSLRPCSLIAPPHQAPTSSCDSSLTCATPYASRSTST